VSQLVEAYLRQTEREKAAQLGGASLDAALPARYRSEIDDPATAYEDSVVHVAESDGDIVGMVVVQTNSTTREIKRLWVDPRARGQRVGSALIDAATDLRDLPVRLTVWDWRDDAIRLYRARGFETVASWEERPRLVCMRLEPERTH
jgi:ribosomal protein S18 acetylase RimI-like enzyme